MAAYPLATVGQGPGAARGRLTGLSRQQGWLTMEMKLNYDGASAPGGRREDETTS